LFGEARWNSGCSGDWRALKIDFAREVAEAALAHVIGDKVSKPIGSNALEKRRALMEAWAAWCEPDDTVNVIRFQTR
jgi:hypothetical protein